VLDHRGRIPRGTCEITVSSTGKTHRQKFALNHNSSCPSWPEVHAGNVQVPSEKSNPEKTRPLYGPASMRWAPTRKTARRQCVGPTVENHDHGRRRLRPTPLDHSRVPPLAIVDLFSVAQPEKPVCIDGRPAAASSFRQEISTKTLVRVGPFPKSKKKKKPNHTPRNLAMVRLGPACSTGVHFRAPV